MRKTEYQHIHLYGATGLDQVGSIKCGKCRASVYSSLPQPEQSGWMKDCDNYAIDWEAAEVMEKIKGTIHFLTKGCSCKKGCKTNNCGCKRRSSHCGPGCACQECTNLPLAQL